MGNRRLGRKRLYALEKAGQSLTAMNGSGSTGAANYSQSREGRLIINEFTVDLAPAAGALSSPGAQDLVIGLSSSVDNTDAGHHAQANLFLVDNSVHGIITDAELICVETPTGGKSDINLARVNGGNLATKALFSGSVDGTVINAGVQSAPQSTAADLAGTDLDGSYLVLTTGASSDGVEATYTAGKFVIRLFGYVEPDDA